MEQEALGPLNPIRYQIKKHIFTTVDKYGYARLHEDIHYNSVPHTYTGKKVQLSYTATDVEICYNYDVIAHHTRDRHNYRPPPHQASVSQASCGYGVVAGAVRPAGYRNT